MPLVGAGQQTSGSQCHLPHTTSPRDPGVQVDDADGSGKEVGQGVAVGIGDIDSDQRGWFRAFRGDLGKHRALPACHRGVATGVSINTVLSYVNIVCLSIC